MEKEKLKFYMAIIFAVILGISSDLLFYRSAPGISFFIFIALGAAFSAFLAKRSGRDVSKEQILILSAAVLLSADVFLRASFFLLFFNIIGSVYLAALFFTLFTNKNLVDFGLLNYVFSPLIYAVRSLFSASGFIEKHREPQEKAGITVSPKFLGVLKGVIIAVPFLIIFSSLLSSADTVFKAYLDNLVNIRIDVDLAVLTVRIFKIFILSFFFVGVFALALKGRKSETIARAGGSQKVIGFTETATILGLVELLFLSFIAIQFYYLFGGRDYVWGIDKYITYSEYARSGFYELIMTALISFLLIFCLDEFGKKEGARENKIFKILSGVLASEIIIILLSSFSRLSLYIDGYGYTFQRFLAFALLFWIGTIFILFLYKIIAAKKEGFFLAGAFSFSVVFWILMNILDPDAFIAQKNIERIKAGKEPDLSYLSSLSEDAVPEIAGIFSANSGINDEVKEKIAMHLYYRYNSRELWSRNTDGLGNFENPKFSELLEKRGQNQDWRSFNVSKNSALKALRDNYTEIVKYQARNWKKEALRCREEAQSCAKSCGSQDQVYLSNCQAACKYYNCENFEKIIETNE